MAWYSLSRLQLNKGSSLGERSRNLTWTFLLWLLTCQTLPAATWCADNVVQPACPPDEDFCQFTFILSANITMMRWVGGGVGSAAAMNPVVLGEDEVLYVRPKACSSSSPPLTDSESETFISGDGSYRRIITVNGELPGTPIVVYKGQTVSVLVSNLLEEVVSIHWHGLRMRGTPWMDGAGSVSHCPIQPRNMFEYRFVADTAGTFWYHGLTGSGRTSGLSGHVTVLDQVSKYERNVQDRLPEFRQEFHFMVTDWLKLPIEEAFMLKNSQSHCQQSSPDGVDVAGFYSATINAKGQRFDPRTDKPDHPGLPVEVFQVSKDGYFRFRIVNSGINKAFKISIDSHMLYVIASDGSDVTTTRVSHVIVSGGETYDVYINASDPDKTGNYWIRAETLEYSAYARQKSPITGHVEAILRYDGAENSRPTSKAHNCTADHRCIYSNCFSQSYLAEDNIECIPISSLRHPAELPTLTPSGGEGFTEYILALETGPRDQEAAINGISYTPHSTPPQIYPMDDGATLCNKDQCLQQGCSCTHVLSLPKDHIIQITLFSPLPSNGSGGTAHPIHLHGHRFQVVKQGWPEYSLTTGQLLEANMDISCTHTANHKWCHTPEWNDPAWRQGNIPDILEAGAPVKNTITVPAGGYVTLRFKADNPGFWYMYSHQEVHHMGGMALVYRAGAVLDMPPVPHAFPTCHDFHWTSQQFLDKLHHPQAIGEAVECELPDISTLAVTTAVLAVTLAFTTLLLLTVTLYRCRHKQQMGGACPSIPPSVPTSVPTSVRRKLGSRQNLSTANSEETPLIWRK